MPDASIQSVFLETVRQSVPPHITFADHLAELLSISRDSAYRRIRGETVLSLDEVSLLCRHFKLSVDAIISPSSEIVYFHNRFVSENDFTFQKWLESINGNLDQMANLREREMIVSAKDVPIFYYFKTPELSAFKMFFWMKSILRYHAYNGKHFRPELVPRELLALGKKIHEKFTRIERTELWSEDTIHASLRQIEFYYECGFFETSAHAQHLCDELLNVITDIKECAALGYLATEREPFHLYKNEINIADNTILFRMDGKYAVFINHNMLNVLTTSQQSFCKQTEDYLRNLLNKATKISGTGERERQKFFNIIEDKVRTLKRRLV